MVVNVMISQVFGVNEALDSMRPAKSMEYKLPIPARFWYATWRAAYATVRRTGELAEPVRD